MLNLTDSEKECFCGRGTYFNDYEFNFPDLNFTITNETLHQESVTIKESICDSEDLQLGGCIASSCEFEVSELAGKELAGLEFTARLLVNDGKDAVVQMGKYRVDSAKRVNDKDYRKITAYDALYDAQIDVSEWYNKVFYVVSQYEELVAVGDIDDLWEHGEYTIDNSGSKPPEVAFFLNGAVPEEAYDTTYLDTSTGKLYEAQDINKDDDSKDELYRWVEIYQCTRKTKTKYIYATTTLKKLRESLLNYLNIPFVEQDIINDDITISRTIDTNENGELLGTDMLKYICEVNAGFGKMNREGKFEVISLLSPGLYPEETLYPSEELYPEDHYEVIASDENSASYISTSYEEYETEGITGIIIKGDSDNVGELAGTKDNPYVISGNPLLYGSTAEKLKEIGQKIYEQIKGYIYRPNTTTLDGLPYLETGDYFVLIKENSDDIGSFIFSRTLSGVQALKDTYESKGNKLRVNEDVQTSELMYLQSRTAKIQKSVDGVSIELANLDENTSSRFEQTASKIEAEVKRASNAEGELSGRITVTADQITQEVTRAKAEEATLSGRITVTAGEITQEVSRATSEENTLRASISLKIDKDDDGQIISMINESADVITLNSNRLVVNSSQFQLDAKGNATFSGKLSSPQIEGKLTTADDLSVANGKFVVNSSAGKAYASVSGYLSVTEYINAFGHIYSADYIETASYLKSDKIQTRYSGDDLEILTTSGGKIKLYDSSESYGVVMDKNSSSKYHLRPGSNGALDCGSASYHWDNVYADNSSIVTSDRNEKMNISDMSEQYANAIIDDAIPKTYMMLNNKSGRTHAGMIAQDLEEQLSKNGMSSKDFAGFIKYEKEDANGVPINEYGYGIRYEEYIAPLIKYSQCLKRDLKQEIERNQQLQFQLLNLQGEFMILKQQILGGK